MTATTQLKMAHAVSHNDIRSRLAALIQAPSPSHGLRDLLLGAVSGGAAGVAGGGVVGLGAGYGRGMLDGFRHGFGIKNPAEAAFDALKNVTPR